MTRASIVSEKHHRRSIRLPGYDYGQQGMYFVTICTENRELLFGEIVGGEMRLSERARIVDGCWQAIPAHFRHVELDEFQIMPNHIHGILAIAQRSENEPSVVGAQHAAPLQRNMISPNIHPGSLAAIIRSFKSAVTSRVNLLRQTPGAPLWQRNYHEHAIRNENDLHRIREYIQTNPLRWELDRENPKRQGKDEFDRWLNGIVQQKKNYS
jgi:REP element-mobilizing transposase RayT